MRWVTLAHVVAVVFPSIALFSCATHQSSGVQQTVTDTQLTKLAELTVRFPENYSYLMYCRNGAPVPNYVAYSSLFPGWSCVELSPDGQSVAIGPLKRGGSEVRRVSDSCLLGSFDSAAPPRFSPDGRYLIFAGGIEFRGIFGEPRFGQSVDIWSATDHIQVTQKHIGRFIEGYVLSPDSSIITVEVLGGVSFEQFPALHQIGTVRKQGRAGRVAFSPDGKIIAIPDEGKIQIVRVLDMKVTGELEGPPITQKLAFSNDGKYLVAAGAVNYLQRKPRSTFRVWRVKDWALISSFREDDQFVTGYKTYYFVHDLVFSSDNKTLIASILSEKFYSKAMLLRAWRVSDGKLIASYVREKKGFLTEFPRYEKMAQAVIHPKLGVLIVRVDEPKKQTDPEQRYIDEPEEESGPGKRIIKIWRHEEFTRLLGVPTASIAKHKAETCKEIAPRKN